MDGAHQARFGDSNPQSTEVDSIAMKRLAVLIAFVIVGLVSAVAPPGRETEAQANCFQETGFCITNPAFAEYFRVRGGTRILGFPVSRSFTLEGFEVQFFQRVVLQLQGNSVNRLNLLDPNVMPMMRVNQSTFPGPDAGIAAQAPQTSSPTYARDVVEFIRKVSPNTFAGQQTRYFDTFNNTVPADIAFGGATPNPELLTLLNLEIWGLPTSNPAPDPANGGFIYQRFQRGIMHFDASCGCTQGILVGEYFKSVITNKSLPPDLADDMKSSRYFNQYNSANAGWINRPGDLQNTDLTGAFEPGTGAVQPGTGQPSGGGQPSQPTNTPAPAGTATPTPTAAASTTIEFQLDDDLIDPGQKVRITVIARNSNGLEWIEWQGDGTGDATLDDNHRYDGCDQRTECASVWEVTPIKAGKHELRARARDKNGVRSDWVTTELRVRDGPTPTPTPSSPTPTPGPGTPTVTPTAVAAAPTVKLQISDDSINLGDTIEITVIASSDRGLDWIEWQGDGSDDPELDQHRFDCDNKKDCARTWTVKPSKKSSVDIRADAKASDGVRASTVRQELRTR
ncbi:MAG: hypothetical protein IT306_16585 [Chloroflexi bacterium]|nr:hypothetical protein [Chloroflexota bacterium]